MKYFDVHFIDFFKSLASNNNKGWFHSNKDRYENHVKIPFEIFITDLINEIRKHDPSLNVPAKACMLRINKDIRFSKDKAPYNLHYTAFVSNGGRRDKSFPGIFLRFSPESVGIMGGCYCPSKEQLKKIRTAISLDTGLFRKLVENNVFVERFDCIKGERLKRIPREWQAAYEKEPIIANKQFYFATERNVDLIMDKYLLEEIMGYWKVMQPVNRFLIKAIEA